jgi:LCP family protein required for cell wall assembly
MIVTSMFLLLGGCMLAVHKFFPASVPNLHWPGEASSLDGRRDFNILIAGLDGSTGQTRTDSIIVAHVDLKNKYANLVSIPRDSRVEIPGYGKYDKINSAYTRGGPELTVKTIENFLGAPVDFYFIFHIEAAIKMVDALGGVDLFVEKNMHYSDRSQNLHIDLNKGFQHLDGKDAIGYARFRHDAAGDFGRIERQQNLIDALTKKITSFEIIKYLPGLAAELVKNQLAFTNLTPGDGLALARAYNSQFRRNLKTFILPGTPQTISGVSYVLPDEKEVPYIAGGLLKGGFHPSNRLIKIAILNGCGAPMISQIYKQRLEYFGFDILRTDNARDFDYPGSVIVVKKKNLMSEPIAKMLNAELRFELDPESIEDLDVILGRDKLETF